MPKLEHEARQQGLVAPPHSRECMPQPQRLVVWWEGVAHRSKGSCSCQALCWGLREALPGEACRSLVSSSFWPLLPGIRRVKSDGEQKSLVPQGVFAQHTLTDGQQCCFPHVACDLFVIHESAPPTFSFPLRMPPSMGFRSLCLLVSQQVVNLRG